jgi:hypothetical protein
LFFGEKKDTEKSEVAFPKDRKALVEFLEKRSALHEEGANAQLCAKNYE